MRHTNIIDISTQVTEVDLRKLEAETPRAHERPQSLPMRDIHVADSFFQRRDLTANRVEHEVHIRELVRVLRDTGRAFNAPLVVTPVGDKYFLIDGHYRLTAYRSVGWSEPLRVQVFEGDLSEAYRESLKLNVESKRPMSLADKLEAAWTLTLWNTLTKAQVAQECAVAARTVATMRSRIREMRLAGEDPAEFTWQQAKDGRPKEELAEEEWLEKQASEWAERFVKTYGSKPRARPDILAAMLYKVDAGLPGALMTEWRGELRDLVEQWDQEEEEAPF